MSGMLPGVEAARRRRVHINTGTTSRPSSFSLYAANHKEYHFRSEKSAETTNPVRCDGYILDDAAREAKKRLDQRFGRKSNGGEGSDTNLKTNLCKLIFKSDYQIC
ncbi:hypothetical protein SASPL_137976 [Salvia splendens]|uniref:Uncharacterized protein n=1 Tax=Salvia splendens TaxID=180675 RepID=A0A8X8WW81_SALSN|nr:hypothetical protein SASPL_137976 [Salvia splendens]